MPSDGVDLVVEEVDALRFPFRRSFRAVRAPSQPREEDALVVLQVQGPVPPVEVGSQHVPDGPVG